MVLEDNLLKIFESLIVFFELEFANCSSEEVLIVFFRVFLEKRAENLS